jgi:hypothetical protein
MDTSQANVVGEAASELGTGLATRYPQEWPTRFAYSTPPPENANLWLSPLVPSKEKSRPPER